MDVSNVIAALEEERNRLTTAIEALRGVNGRTKPAASSSAHPSGLPMRIMDGRQQFEVEPGRWVGRARLNQLGLSLTGRRCSEASRKLMSESMKKRWAQKHAEAVQAAVREEEPVTA
jgi:hypothetical protein